MRIATSKVSGRYRLRKATAADAGALTALARRSKASNGYDAAFMRACEAELTYTPETIRLGETWIAEDRRGRLLGFFDLRPHKAEGDVYAMFVEPSAKRLGIGRVLWQKLEKCAKTSGMKAVTLDADPFAVSFYEAMGLGIVGEAPSGSIPGRKLPHMRKTLVPGG